MGNRHRYMYYATGLPGWMRFGYSPGWLGVSPTGMGPAASYLMTGQWPTPQMAAAWQGRQFPMAPGGAAMGQYPMGAGPTPPGTMGYPMDPDQELQFLKDQAQMLAQQLEQISSRIDEIEKAEKKEKKAGK
jgi:hypothetical protein